MTRIGKIARLPFAIREQVNHRLLDGQSTDAILRWLNALPEVKSVLAAEFDSIPISPSNLSEWRTGGYHDWLVRQETLNLTRSLNDKESLGEETLAARFADKLAHWLTLQYAATAARHLASEDLSPEARWTRLRQLCADVTRLQREEHHALQIDISRDRLELACQNVEWQRKTDMAAAERNKGFSEIVEKAIESRLRSAGQPAPAQPAPAQPAATPAAPAAQPPSPSSTKSARPRPKS